MQGAAQTKTQSEVRIKTIRESHGFLGAALDPKALRDCATVVEITNRAPFAALLTRQGRSAPHWALLASFCS